MKRNIPQNYSLKYFNPAAFAHSQLYEYFHNMVVVSWVIKEFLYFLCKQIQDNIPWWCIFDESNHFTLTIHLNVERDTFILLLLPKNNKLLKFIFEVLLQVARGIQELLENVQSKENRRWILLFLQHI